MQNSVSIHALLAECDTRRRFMNTSVFSFNPRTPCGVRPLCPFSTLRRLSFNPRTPCGVRPFVATFSLSAFWFQSTHSLRSATWFWRNGLQTPLVSIHALLAECDVLQVFLLQGVRLSFNPRTPCGVRPSISNSFSGRNAFQSTHSLRSATAPDHIHCYSTAQTILCANLPKKAIIT